MRDLRNLFPTTQTGFRSGGTTSPAGFGELTVLLEGGYYILAYGTG
jgi:hypothetical protein